MEISIIAGMMVALVIGIGTGFPIAFVLMSVGLIFGSIALGPEVAFRMLTFRAYGIMMHDGLVAVPLFIFMGYMMDRSGIAAELYESLRQAMAPVRGALALATIVTGTILAATTGIIGASVTMMGLLALPTMIKRGYDIPLATGSIIAGGTLGILIPPSIMLIIYGPMAALSIVHLFAAAIVPGLLLATLYMIYIAIRCGIQPHLGPPLSKEERIPPKELFYKLLTSVIPSALLILAVLGSILLGVAAPTEAAAVGGFGATVLTVFYRKLNWKVLQEVVYGTLKVSSMSMMIVVGGSIFSATFMAVGGGRMVTDFILALPLGPAGILLTLMAIVFILGVFIDWLSILIIIVPVLTPIVAELGFNPLWFAMLVCVNLQTAKLTPPFAYGIFYLKGVAPPEVKLADIYRGVVPFVIIQLIGLALCILFPQIILWLPGIVH